MTRKQSNKKYRTTLRHLCTDALGGKCSICGTTKRKLHFHHTNPTTKTASIAYLIRTHPEKLIDELPKCELLCDRCHRKHHYG